MKRLLSIFFISFILGISLYGQWYTRKYGVSDIRNMTDIQLRESLSESKNIAIAGGLAGIVSGGLMIIVAETIYRNGLPDDATFGEELLGSRFMKTFYKVGGIGLVGCGVIAGIVGLGRSGSIRRVMNERNLTFASMTLRPVVLNTNNYSLYPGLSFSIRF